MTKQTINLGTGELTGDGESIRSALSKVNSNFDELYAVKQDFTAINQSIIPDTNETYDLGSANNRFRDLYLSGNTINLNGITLSAVNGTLEVGGSPIIAQSDLSNYVTQAQLAAGSITVNPTGDLQGSVFADDSTILVDGVAGKIRGDIESDTVNITSNVGDVNITAADDIDLETTGANADIRLSSNDNIRLFSVSDTGIASDTYVGIFTDASNSLHNFIFSETGYFEALADNGGINVSNELNFISGGSPTATMKLNSTILEVENTGGFRLKDSGGNTQMEYLNTGTGVLNVAGTINGTLNGDVTGSVFADDSTLLVDGVNGIVAGTLTGNWINSGNKFNVLGEGIDVTTGSSIFSVVDPGLSFTNSYNGESVALNVSGGGLALSGTGNLSIGIDSIAASLSGGIAIAVSNDISISAGDFTLSATTINLGGEVNASGNFTGSVFADDSIVLVDGVAGKIVGPVETNWVVAPEGENLALGVVVGGFDSASVLINESDITLQSDITFGSASYTFDFNGATVSNLLLNSITSGLTAPGSAVVAGETEVDFNFSGVSTTVSIDRDGNITGTQDGAISGFDNITIRKLDSDKINEAFDIINSASGVTVHDCLNDNIFVHTALNGDFTANLSNLELPQVHSTKIKMLLIQGNTPYMCTGIQIDSLDQTIYWEDGVEPNGTADQRDLVEFTIFRTGPAVYTVLGKSTSYS